MAKLSYKEQIYNTWAPPNGLWTPWAKPVLFATMDQTSSTEPLTPSSTILNWMPPAEEKTAIILDLPREQSVLVGLELAGRGYRPVPLYNAIPKPVERKSWIEGNKYSDAITLVEVIPIQAALQAGATVLQNLSIPLDAPPVFLLDANRRLAYRWPPHEGDFDNRSVSFTTDFPSALFLKTHGISRAILVQLSAIAPQSDLAHTLRRWQDAGVVIQMKSLDNADTPAPYLIPKPSWFGAIWYRVLVASGLRKHALGGYGGIIGPSSAG